MQTERIDVTLNLTHPAIGDLSIALQSPSGIRSSLLYRPGEGPNSAIGSSQDNIHFTFDTVANWGEDTFGLWTLHVADQAASASGTLDNWTLALTGKGASDSNSYIFTNEYSESLGADPTRGTLTDAAGIDTLNVAAVTSASTIILTPGAVSTIDGVSLVINASTVIERVLGGDGNDAISGNSAANWLRGMRGNDELAGGAGSDTLEVGAGNDVVDGGSGIDTAVVTGTRSNFTVTKTMAGYTITDNAGSEGVDTLRNVERIKFGDKSLALDADGNSGQVYRLYQAALNRKPDLTGIGYWMDLLDNGASLPDVAAGFTNSVEFKDLYGTNPSNATLITSFYQNVLHRAPDPVGFNFWKNVLDNSGALTQVLIGFSESSENQAQVIGVIQSGIDYLPAV